MLTKGQYRVGVDFNPAKNLDVQAIKETAAQLIDMIEAIHSDRETERGNEVARLKALAMTAIEEGAMWAVKAATKPARGY